MRIVALLLLILTPWSVAAEPLRTDYLNSQLISQSTTAVPGGLLMLGLWLEHDAGWHTYWQNPGDSGLPTRMTVEIGGEEQQADFLWPLPERFPLDAQLVNFGYKGRVVLPLMVQLPSNLDGDSLSIRARASWLVCEEACIPGITSTCRWIRYPVWMVAGRKRWIRRPADNPVRPPARLSAWMASR